MAGLLEKMNKKEEDYQNYFAKRKNCKYSREIGRGRERGRGRGGERERGRERERENERWPHKSIKKLFHHSFTYDFFLLLSFSFHLTPPSSESTG